MEGQIKETPPEGEEKQPLEGSTAVEAEAKKPEEGEKVEGEVAPPSYSQEQVNKIIAGLKADFDGKRKEHDKQYDDSIAQIRKDHEEVLTRERERKNQEFLKSVEDSGGDVDVAKRLVAREEVALKQAKELEARERAVEAKETEQYEMGKVFAAHKIASEVGMDVDELLKAKDPMEMRALKAEFIVEKQKSEQKPPVKTDSGVSSAKGVDWSKMTPQEKLAKGLEGMQL